MDFFGTESGRKFIKIAAKEGYSDLSIQNDECWGFCGNNVMPTKLPDYLQLQFVELQREHIDPADMEDAIALAIDYCGSISKLRRRITVYGPLKVQIERLTSDYTDSNVAIDLPLNPIPITLTIITKVITITMEDLSEYVERQAIAAREEARKLREVAMLRAASLGLVEMPQQIAELLPVSKPNEI